MLQILSKLFDVSINELLSGVRLDEKHYKENAEEYIVTDLMKKRNEAIDCFLYCSLSNNSCWSFDNSFECFAFRAYLVKNHLYRFFVYYHNSRRRGVLRFDC